MKKYFLSIILVVFLGIQSFSQEVGEIREIELVLVDIPFSGDAKQPNFFTLDSSEIYSFNDLDWLDKHLGLYEFFHKYNDICQVQSLHFMVTMIYIPKEVYVHQRYEGYQPTGEIMNTWVLTSIIEIVNDSE